MNALILQPTAAQALLDAQKGQVRLMPLPLTDGTLFLLEEVLHEPMYNGELDGIEYDVVPWSQVQPLLPPQTEEL